MSKNKLNKLTMFTQSAFTENTPEMREYLEKIGYKHLGNVSGYFLYCGLWNDLPQYRTTDDFSVAKYSNTIRGEKVNCLGNPDLFKSVTALRDDSAYMQLFTDGNIWIQSNNKDFRFDTSIPSDIVKNAHKATIEELISHFNMKKQ